MKRTERLDIDPPGFCGIEHPQAEATIDVARSRDSRVMPIIGDSSSVEGPPLHRDWFVQNLAKVILTLLYGEAPVTVIEGKNDPNYLWQTTTAHCHCNQGLSNSSKSFILEDVGSRSRKFKGFAEISISSDPAPHIFGFATQNTATRQIDSYSQHKSSEDPAVSPTTSYRLEGFQATRDCWQKSPNARKHYAPSERRQISITPSIVNH